MDDEDVDLEHSELYRHSRANGFTASENECMQDDSSLILPATSKVPVLKRLKQFLERLIFPWNLSLPTKYIEFSNNEFYKAIAGCGTLAEEDALFLEAVMPDGAVSNIWTLATDLPVYLRLATPLVPILVYESAKLVFPATARCRLFTVLVGGATGSQLLASLALLRRLRRRRQLLTRMRHLMVSAEVYVRLVRKCLRLMQELEVIGRGLLLVMPLASSDRLANSSLLPPTASLPTACRCVGLRQSLTDTVTAQFRLMRHATVHLIAACPLRPDIDHRTHYIAFSAEEDLQSTIKFEDNEEEISAWSKLNTASLRSICQLYGVQLSEFLRRLGSCFVPEFACPTSEPEADNEKIVEALTQLLERLIVRLADSSATLNEAYRFQRLITTGRPNRGSPERRSKTDQADDHSAHQMALRSLALHLEVGLARVQDLLAADKDATECSVEAPPSEAVIFFGEQFRAIRQDLQSCVDCLEEGELRFRKLFNVVSTESDLTAEACKMDACMEQSACTTVIPLTGKTDIAPADQIFEAYVDSSEIANDMAVDGSWDTDARRNNREARDVANRMFKELKTVLVPKAEEWQVREAKAIGATVAPTDASGFVTAEPLLRTSAIDDRRSTDLVTSNAGIRFDAVDTETSGIDDKVNEAFASFVFPSSIAAMAAARGRAMNAGGIRDSDTFTIGGSQEECYGSSDDEKDSSQESCASE